MLTIAIFSLAFLAFLMLVMLWYINENLARIVNELSWFGKRAEKADRERQGNSHTTHFNE
jgi:hypothetical protein